MAERIPVPGGPSLSLDIPKQQAPRFDAIEYTGALITQTGLQKKEMEDVMEANRLLSEYSIQARQIQSEIMRTDLREDELLPTYDKRLKELEKMIAGQSKSNDVQQLLDQNLPQRSAAKLVEMQAESDRRFSSKALGEYEDAKLRDSAAYASAMSEAERKDIKNRHTNLINIMKARGVFDEQNATKASNDFLKGLEMFDIEKEISSDYVLGLQALTDPKKFLERFPNVSIDQLDNIHAKSVQYQEQMRVLLDRKKKEARDRLIFTVDEAAIKGKMSWDMLNTIRDKDLIDPIDYRRVAALITRQSEEGGVSDPMVKNMYATQIRLNPYSVSPTTLANAITTGALNSKDAQELLDLQKTTQGHIRAESSEARAQSNFQYEQASRVNPRFKGPLFQEGKTKIDMVVGKGMTISVMPMDDNTARRWGAAMDEYLTEIQRNPDKPHMVIADEIVKRYQGPAKPAEIVPKKYQNEKLPNGIDAKRLREDYQKSKDPNEKKRLLNLLDQINETKQTQ